MIITRKSRLTGLEQSMEINIEPHQIAAWEGGVLAQDAMPDLTGDEREFVMTGITREEWISVFGENEQ